MHKGAAGRFETPAWGEPTRPGLSPEGEKGEINVFVAAVICLPVTLGFRTSRAPQALIAKAVTPP